MARTRSFSHVSFGSRTDVGCVRDHNEDSLLVAPPLFVVADGMGGHAAGEVASEIAVNIIDHRAPEHPDSGGLSRAVVAANHAIIKAAREGRGREGMGTTCTAAMLEGERLVIAQVGDSRAYLLHHGSLQQITRDHSLMADLIEAGQLTPAEARVHPQRSVITRALGSDPATQPDLYEINVESGDRLLLCSDGLSGMVTDAEIEDILTRVSDPQRCASSLVNCAIKAGGYDNITVVVVDVTGFAAERTKKIARKTKATIAVVCVLLAAAVVAAGFGLSYWIQNSAYLAEYEGNVAIYRGVPGQIFGISASELERTTDISLDDLQPGTAQRLRNGGITVDNMEAAEKLVYEYEEMIAEQKADEAAREDETDAGAADATNSTGATTNADATNSTGATTNADATNSTGATTNADATTDTGNADALPTTGGNQT